MSLDKTHLLPLKKHRPLPKRHTLVLSSCFHSGVQLLGYCTWPLQLVCYLENYPSQCIQMQQIHNIDFKWSILLISVLRLMKEVEHWVSSYFCSSLDVSKQSPLTICLLCLTNQRFHHNLLLVKVFRTKRFSLWSHSEIGKQKCAVAKLPLARQAQTAWETLRLELS